VIARTGAVLLAVVLAGCVATPRVPVEHRTGDDMRPSPLASGSQRRGVERTHVVTRGDTLYAIAWQYGLDYRVLARLNGIRDPYVIYAGQRLRLPAPDAATGTMPPAAVAPVPVAPPARVHPRAPAGADVAGADPAGATRQAPAWVWPGHGRVVTPFAVSGKGIDLAAAWGDEVRAAAAGEVVYAGNGIRGYGELVIVRHDDDYLSAYGHNRKIVVREGDRVKAGDVVAETGYGNDATAPRLYFEIRRSGKPVDPPRLLPERR